MNFLKTPDLLKTLPEFTGKPTELEEFVRSASLVWNALSTIENAPLQLWLQVLRNKIKGKASDRLRLYGNPDTWDGIKDILYRHFQDHRDERTLYNQLSLIRQTSSLSKFYDDILDIITTLNARVRQNEDNLEIRNRMIRRNIKEGLETFVKGLRDPFRTIVMSRDPDTLEEAYEITLSLAEASRSSTINFNNNQQRVNRNNYNNNNNNNYQNRYNNGNSNNYYQNRNNNNNDFWNRNNDNNNMNRNNNYNNNTNRNNNFNNNNSNRNNNFNNNFNNRNNFENNSFRYRNNNSGQQRTVNGGEPMDVDPNPSTIQRGLNRNQNNRNFRPNEVYCQENFRPEASD
ncbi:putative uncharacterized protein DDB_G0286901 [Eupeodes corollae]|uniref:putative uncharacterized protein DDB_G0286901 n=1 Tax=Eupeodes corollae TaxID=290404 RepID=UPI00248FCCC8|nr:putative uncharacterized protein DDB_G0286901 [Eupeodes corollae]